MNSSRVACTDVNESRDEVVGKLARAGCVPPGAADAPVPAAAAAVTAEGTLLEVTLPVLTRVGEEGEGLRTLGIAVRTGKGGANGVSRVVLVRLTDPNDPFFLFEMELLEDDYGAFKQRLELRVDFNGFPRFLVGMIRAVAEGASNFELALLISGGGGARGTLRLVEATEFKTVEHLSLALVRQGDVGQKRYLAERARLFEDAYRRRAAEADEQLAQAQQRAAELERRAEELTEANRAAREELRVQAADAEKARLAAVAAEREARAAEVAALRGQQEQRSLEQDQRTAALQRQLLDEMGDKASQVAALKERVAALDSALTAARSGLRSAEDTAAAQAQELQGLRATNADLAAFKLEVTRTMSENELSYVTVSERLRALTREADAKDAELRSLREQCERQDQYVSILSRQNEQATGRAETAEKSLDKAHHIIAHQLQTIKAAKERCQVATQQLRSQEALVAEREGALHRVRDDLAAASERVQGLLRRNSELKEQLELTDDAREKLAQELKQTQAALLQLQRGVTGRRWGASAVGTALASSELAAAGLASYTATPSYLSGSGLAAAAAPTAATAPGDSAEFTKTEPRRLQRPVTPDATDVDIKAIIKERHATGGLRALGTNAGAGDVVKAASALASKSFFQADTLSSPSSAAVASAYF